MRPATLAGLGIALVLAAALALVDRGEERDALVGFAEDLPKWDDGWAAREAAALGATALRITLQWPGDRSALDDAEIAALRRAVASGPELRWILSVYGVVPGGDPPLDAAARERYCAFVRDALERVPEIRDVVIWNEPNNPVFWRPAAGAPAAYAALLARCWDVLHAAFDDVNVVGLALAPNGWDDGRSLSPGAFIRALGAAYRASGRAERLFDTVAHHPYLRNPREPVTARHPGKKEISLGDRDKLDRNLELAFAGTAQPLPGEGGVELWYLELGFQTAVAPGREAAYTGVETLGRTLAEAEQGERIAEAFAVAACQPHVGAILNFLLADEQRLEGWQSGAFRADRTRKASYPAFARALADAREQRC